MAKTEELAPEAEDAGLDTEVKAERLNLEVKVDAPTACERHVTVNVAREDVDRYFDKAFSEMMPTAAVPGFRAGRAPRKLVEARFRKDMADQVKGSLLMDSIGQVLDDSKLSAISEPEFDAVAVKVPDDGPLTFEFDIEVRPEFNMPNWKGLKIERPVKEFTKKDVDARLEQILTRYGRLVPFDGAAAAGDYVTCNLAFKNGDELISEAKEEVIRIRPVLSFRDGRIEKFDKQIAGAKGGDTRTLEAKISDEAPNEALRGKTVSAVVEVLEVKKLELPLLTPAFLEDMGFKDEAELRAAVEDELKRQLDYAQQQRARQQITGLLTESASWELPPALLKRQSRRELERSVLELRRAGFSDQEIRAHENDLRQNSAVNTARSLKEHFILERIAEDESIDAASEDYDQEIQLIALQSEESPRRVRARLEKQGMMDALRNQIVERKVIALVLGQATFKDVPYKAPGTDAEAIEASAGGDEDVAIPEAKHAEGPQALPTPTQKEQ